MTGKTAAFAAAVFVAGYLVGSMGPPGWLAFMGYRGFNVNQCWLVYGTTARTSEGADLAAHACAEIFRR